MNHFLDQALQLKPDGPDRFRGATHPGYANMVGPYGGMTAAVMLQAALIHPARLGVPLSLTVNYAAPVADGPFDIEARPLRTNRSTQHWLLLLSQQGQVAASATALFGVRRPTWSANEALPPPGVPPAADVPVAQAGSFLPPWVSRYQKRFVRGALPDSFDGVEQPESGTVLWVRDEPPRPWDFASLAAVIDCFVPRVFLRRRRHTPAGTVTMSVAFHADEAWLAEQGDRPLLGTARALAFHDGYFDQLAEIWSDDGRLLASSLQVVYFKG
jgi:acyl-CoA thioesterase